MSGYQRTVSLLLILHLVSLGVHSLAPPEDVTHAPNDLDRSRDRLSRLVTPFADTALAIVESVNRTLWHTTTPVRAVTSPYLEASALYQRWEMFAVPALSYQYLRTRYYWRASHNRDTDAQRLTATELVFPVDREDEIRLLAAFPNSFRNKAGANVVKMLQDGRGEGPEVYSAQLRSFLAFFSECFERGHLQRSDALFRAELWYGTAAIAEPGHRPSSEQSTAHLDTMRAYYDGPRPQVFSRRRYPRVGTVEHEADIVWELVETDFGRP